MTIEERKAVDIPKSETISSTETGLPKSCSATEAPDNTFADITVSVSVSDACAYLPRADALKSVTGLSTISPLPTIQSRTFFRTPGIACAHFGTDNTRPSAVFSLDRPSFTACGTASSSRSGLKCGRSPIPSKRDIRTTLGSERRSAPRARIQMVHGFSTQVDQIAA